MPYIILKKNGKRHRTPFVFTRDEVTNLAMDSNACYVVQNTGTHRIARVGGKCRKPTSLSQLDGGFLQKLFGKKKPKPRVGDRTIYMIPTPGGGYVSRMAGARRRRRRR